MEYPELLQELANNLKDLSDEQIEEVVKENWEAIK